MIFCVFFCYFLCIFWVSIHCVLLQGVMKKRFCAGGGTSRVGDRAGSTGTGGTPRGRLGIGCRIHMQEGVEHETVPE